MTSVNKVGGRVAVAAMALAAGLLLAVPADARGGGGGGRGGGLNGGGVGAGGFNGGGVGRGGFNGAGIGRGGFNAGFNGGALNGQRVYQPFGTGGYYGLTNRAVNTGRYGYGSPRGYGLGRGGFNAGFNGGALNGQRVYQPYGTGGYYGLTNQAVNTGRFGGRHGGNYGYGGFSGYYGGGYGGYGGYGNVAYGAGTFGNSGCVEANQVYYDDAHNYSANYNSVCN